LEIGFGTGLNAFLTLLAIHELKKKIFYIAIEKYPLLPFEYNSLNYPHMTNPEFTGIFQRLHECEWEKPVWITPKFSIQKINVDFRNQNVMSLPLFDVIYFDAFAPDKQPDLWLDDIYRKIYNHSNDGAVFVTYCAKGVVRRDLQKAGFNVERIPGPPGKKEMLRALK
jgi:tRNA U34 5-methylaminomethyl-2-thiouridine-forming methyltransferase MnmC